MKLPKLKVQTLAVSNILLNIYYETAQAESADSVSNISLKILSENCYPNWKCADSVSNISLKIYSENWYPSWKCKLYLKHFTTTFGHVIKSSKLQNSGMSIIIVVLINIITFS